MTQLTLRDFDPRLEAELRRVAAAENISLNKAAQKLMMLGAGLGDSPQPSRCIGSALDRFIGTLSAGDETVLLESTQVLERIDDEFWK